MGKGIIIYLVGILTYGIANALPYATCRDGWLAWEGNCYLFGKLEVHFIEAEHYCRQHNNSHLVEIESSLENDFIKDHLRDTKSRCFWLGLTDEAIEGDWRWYLSNNQATFTDWAPAEPHGTGPYAGDCGLFWPDYDFRWGDLTCTYNCSPLCKSKGLGESVDIVGRRK